jgi:peptidyl-prolyl cis-trans isomerase-like protein 2
MGKKTDRMYITQQEWALDFGGAKKTRTSSDFVRLPFSCCAISLKPFEHPVCSPDGIVFDLTNIIPWLAKHGNNPVTGLSLDRKQLVKLNFYQTQGEYQCPVTFKTFSDNTHIVAIKTTGNVFSYDAVDKLNIQAKNYKDLLTDEPFTKKDIITLQDPHQLSLRNINSFHYKVNDISVQTKKEKQELSALPNLINAQGSTKRILDEMQKSVSVTPSFVKPKERSRNEAHFSTGLAAASLTSTHFNPSTKNEAALITDQDYLLANVKDKALVQIATSKGTMQFQLNCKECPQTTFNFIQLANKQYYDNLKFHRLIRGFMMQSGDPTGTGSGGDSIWGKPFVDELASNLKHNCKGMLAMANKGPNTNRSQLYIFLN